MTSIGAQRYEHVIRAPAKTIKDSAILRNKDSGLVLRIAADVLLFHRCRNPSTTPNTSKHICDASSELKKPSDEWSKTTKWQTGYGHTTAFEKSGRG